MNQSEADYLQISARKFDATLTEGLRVIQGILI